MLIQNKVALLLKYRNSKLYLCKSVQTIVSSHQRKIEKAHDYLE